MGHDSIYFAYISYEEKTLIGRIRLANKFMGQNNFRNDEHSIQYDVLPV